MGMLVRLFGLVVAAFVATVIGGAIAARSMKERIVPVDDPEADEVTLAAIFGPIDFRSTSTAFRGGTLECWYGGGSIDLRGATLAPDGARLQVKAIFGGAQIVVPESWNVTTRIAGIGGAGDMRSTVDRTADSPHLTIEGIALFGGVGVTSTISEEQATAMSEAVARAKAKASASGSTSIPAAPERDPVPAG